MERSRLRYKDFVLNGFQKKKKSEIKSTMDRWKKLVLDH